MNYSHRFFLYGPVGLFAILMAAVMGYWWLASNAMSRQLDAANGQQIAPGIRFSFAKKAMSGFPFRVDCELDGLRLSIDTSHGPAIWTAEHFAFHSLSYNRRQFILEAAGQQHLEWHKDNGALRSYDFLPGSLRASVLLDGATLARFDLDLLNAASAQTSASRVQIHLRRDPLHDALDIFASADNVNIAVDEELPFGPRLSHAALNALLSPGERFDAFLSGQTDWRAAAADWHARDGGLLVNSIVLNWGALNVAGKGALAVDDLHRPVGALHFMLADANTLVGSLQKNAAGSQAGEGLGQALFADLSTAHADTSKAVPVALTFKDGIAYIGMMPADLLSPLF